MGGNHRIRVGVFALAALVSACGGSVEDAANDPADGPRELPREPGGSTPIDPPTSACESDTPEVDVQQDWRFFHASQPAFDTLRFGIKARPDFANLDGIVAIGGQEILHFSDAKVLVRFNADGFVDARDGDGYRSDVSFPYEAGAWYTIVVTADIENRTYDVEVGRCLQEREVLIKDAAFRSSSSVSDRLIGWGLWSSSGDGLGVSVPTWEAAGQCAPASCELLSLECGQPTDGCGGILSCGACPDGMVCENGVCAVNA